MKKINLLLFSIVLIFFSCKDKRVLEPANAIKDPIAIGASYQGGVIFYIDSTKQHGFIAATSDVGNSPGPISIPDNSTPVTSNISVSGISGNVGAQLVKVCVNITHQFDADLDIILRAPNGQTIELSTDNGGSGDDYSNTCFTNSGPSITGGTAPFAGSFMPEQSFSWLSGSIANGNWSLIIYDDYAGDTGSLINWSITFNSTTFYYPATGITWNNGVNMPTGAGNIPAGYGQTNTNAIITAQGPGTYAATLCDNYVSDSYSDWFLPNANEMQLMYAQKSVISGLTNGWYWTSLEASANNAYVYNILTGLSGTMSKSAFAKVRPIRSF